MIVVELKQGSFKPEYKGQMELYLRWLGKHETEAGKQSPIGIILCAGKIPSRSSCWNLAQQASMSRSTSRCLGGLPR
ncbi:MAG: PDDEXK nuclease domain-containing protein [Candidatus Sulfotelmatobacter sp.]